MRDSMRFSIIVPVYNVEEYLQQCIDSILANDCSDCEILLVDDGSTDNVSPRLCDENAARHPDLIRVIHQENKGPGGARNTGLEAARGEYVFFVDSDDTIAPNALKRLSEEVERTHADIYTFHMASHDGTGSKTFMKVSICEGSVIRLEDHPEALLSIPAIWARIWRRDLFTHMNIRFPDRVWIGEDLRTTTKLLASASTIAMLSDTLYFYLVRPGSIMQSRNVMRNKDMIASIDATVKWFKEEDMYDSYQNELCYLAVDHLLLATTVRVVKTNLHSPLTRDILDYVQTMFPDYRKNPYVKQMPLMRKVLLLLVEQKLYGMIRILFFFKDRM